MSVIYGTKQIETTLSRLEIAGLCFQVIEDIIKNLRSRSFLTSNPLKRCSTTKTDNVYTKLSTYNASLFKTRATLSDSAVR